MRNLIFAINLTLDGCCDHTKATGSDDILEYFTDLLRTADTFVYGRKTYQLMVPYWPDMAKNNSGETSAGNGYAQAFVAVDKMVVFSKSLDKGEGKNTRIVRSDLPGEIARLKQEPGKNILTGGVDLPTQLIELGLIDEYLFVIHPILAGEGRRLLEGVSLPEKLQLKFAGSTVLRSGCIALRYLKS